MRVTITKKILVKKFDAIVEKYAKNSGAVPWSPPWEPKGTVSDKENLQITLDIKARILESGLNLVRPHSRNKSDG